MGLLWTFMGASAPYQMLAGLAEVTCGMLLFWRRSRLLGALLAIGVMGNVVALNYCYDVPVKLFSTELLRIRAASLPRELSRTLVATGASLTATSLAVVPNAVAPGLSPAEILSALRPHLDPVFLPRPIVVVDSLPRDGNGKIPAAALQALIAAHIPATD